MRRREEGKKGKKKGPGGEDGPHRHWHAFGHATCRSDIFRGPFAAPCVRLAPPLPWGVLSEHTPRIEARVPGGDASRGSDPPMLGMLSLDHYCGQLVTTTVPSQECVESKLHVDLK